ncbi:Short-chain dehydrogenase/reductase family protein [Mycena indigotica]|uniref:Short-chain dehydrogenase/reductase family protein n=1 Tax=Mycena indigotica TaxID=2126181 RepID=A0A8H6W1H0_9AGAR|nr:Short-chain dehydrogenase/reductase family protein [Mycena indigotica]KAF7299506.1 Short-chain dehydrogenase/reductase family protein [Mycena indigotica]
MSYPELGFKTTAEEAADAFANEIKGKNVLITGTSVNGIGFEAARAIAKHANLVVITGYNEERLKLSEEAIKKDIPSANVRKLILDLNSLAAVRKAAAEVNAYSEPLHVLVNNAAAPLGPFATTADGLETQIGVGHVAAFLFTKLVTPKLLASATADYTPRVVFIGSQAHMFGPGVVLDVIKPGLEGVPFPPHVSYFSVKSANILTASELSRRAKGKLHAFSIHPGIIVTNFGTKSPAIPVMHAMGLVDEKGVPNTKDFEWKSIPQGAATTVTAAFDPRIAGQSGGYLNDNKVMTEMVAEHTASPDNAAKLWEVTETVIGEKYEF